MVRAERHRKQLAQGHGAVQPIRSAEVDLRIVAGELAQLLAAAATGRDDLGPRSDDDALENTLLPGSDHGGNGAGLGAGPSRVGSVLYIAAAMDRTILGADGGADMELRIGRISMEHHALREVEQVLH